MIDADVLVESKRWKKIIKNPKSKISKILKKFPNKYKFFYKKVSICVLLTNNQKIKSLNKKFRNKNKPTDILSFPNFDNKNLKKKLQSKKFYLGDIVISYEEFSKKNINDHENGFIKIFIHGFLHLLNYDHKSNNEFKVMSDIENQIFHKVKG